MHPIYKVIYLFSYTPEPIENWADYMENEELEKSQTSTLHKKQRYKFLLRIVFHCSHCKLLVLFLI